MILNQITDWLVAEAQYTRRRGGRLRIVYIPTMVFINYIINCYTVTEITVPEFERPTILSGTPVSHESDQTLILMPGLLYDDGRPPIGGLLHKAPAEEKLYPRE